MFIRSGIAIMISIVIGVALTPFIIDAIENTEGLEEAPAGVQTLIDALPIVFWAALILGAVSWIVSGSGGEHKEDQYEEPLPDKQKKPTGHIPAKKKERVREPAQHASVLGMVFDSIAKRIRRRSK